MTDEEREKITFLRYKGYGYKKTTNTIGLSRDSVRGYCIRNGLDGYGTGIAKEYKKVMEVEFVYILLSTSNIITRTVLELICIKSSRIK